MSTNDEISKTCRPSPADAELRLCHELSEPLTALGQYLQAARRRLASAAPGDKAFADILDKASIEVNRAGDLVRDLRGYLGGGGPLPPATTMQHGRPVLRDVKR